MMRVNKIGCALITVSVGVLSGPRKFENFFI
jgi:hypothetical protein